LSTTSPAGAKPRGAKRVAKSTSALKVGERTINELAELFKKLADKSRLKILLALAQDGELHVSALCKLLRDADGKPASQPAVSHHLNLLRAHRLVQYRRDGKHNYYRIDSALVRALLQQFFDDSGNGHKQIQFEDFAVSFKLK
jgi:ArsR family transcriptional regulator, arsenate/arsenite/antimonite-responsive transcriptional repressor